MTTTVTMMTRARVPADNPKTVDDLPSSAVSRQASCASAAKEKCDFFARGYKS
jgi:hypothetical protein